MVNKGVSEGAPSFAIHSASHLIQTRLEQQLTETSVYQPTRCFLEQLWSRIWNGAALAFYEHAKPVWQGETQAVDEFLIGNEPNEKVTKLWWNYVPGAYLRKG